MYTISAGELQREMFKTEWAGRSFARINGSSVEVLSPSELEEMNASGDRAVYTVPHGYGYAV